MLKKVLSVLKEISIIVLLCIIILLILGILFYDYIPINKTMPTQQAYVTPEEVKKEIEESISESEKIEVTYEVTDSDLDMYKQSGSYTEGKANPFALSEDLNNIEDTNNIKDTEQNTNEGQQGNNSNVFWDNEGIK